MIVDFSKDYEYRDDMILKIKSNVSRETLDNNNNIEKIETL